jgi:hypothetical protein
LNSFFSRSHLNNNIKYFIFSLFEHEANNFDRKVEGKPFDLVRDLICFVLFSLFFSYKTTEEREKTFELVSIVRFSSFDEDRAHVMALGRIIPGMNRTQSTIDYNLITISNDNYAQFTAK